MSATGVVSGDFLARITRTHKIALRHNADHPLLVQHNEETGLLIAHDLQCGQCAVSGANSPKGSRPGTKNS